MLPLIVRDNKGDGKKNCSRKCTEKLLATFERLAVVDHSEFRVSDIRRTDIRPHGHFPV